LYIIISISVLFLSIAAVFVAIKAMKKGLTYSTMSATVWSLGFIAVARLSHTITDVLSLSGKFELIEYGLYALAYVVFIVLAARTSKINRPK